MAHQEALFEAPLAHEVAEPLNLRSSCRPRLEPIPTWHGIATRYGPSARQDEWEGEDACPAAGRPFTETVSGFGRYTASIAPVQQETIARVADLVVQSFRPGCPPITWILLEGHADRDVQRGPRFEQSISNTRAAEVEKALASAIRQRSPSILPRIAFHRRGLGASQRLVANPINEAARLRNRRVRIFLVPGAPPPPPPERIDLQQVIQRSLDLLQRRRIPNDPQGNRTQRLQCVLQKLQRKDVNDLFIDGRFAREIGPEYKGNYGRLTPQQFRAFLSSVRVDLIHPAFSRSSSDDTVLDALEDIERRIILGIQKVDQYLEVNSASPDMAREQMRDYIRAKQQKENTIYWCYRGQA